MLFISNISWTFLTHWGQKNNNNIWVVIISTDQLIISALISFILLLLFSSNVLPNFSLKLCSSSYLNNSFILLIGRFSRLSFHPRKSFIYCFTSSNIPMPCSISDRQPGQSAQSAVAALRASGRLSFSQNKPFLPQTIQKFCFTIFFFPSRRQSLKTCLLAAALLSLL